MNTIKGKVIVKNETIKVTEKFSKRTFVVEEAGDYPQLIEVELQQDKCSLIDSIQVGQVVEAHYNLRGRSWTNPQGEVKYFNTIVVWKIDAMAKELQSTSEKMAIADEVGDDLPF
jgi:single-strand DNA-binding protein